MKVYWSGRFSFCLAPIVKYSLAGSSASTTAGLAGSDLASSFPNCATTGLVKSWMCGKFTRNKRAGSPNAAAQSKTVIPVLRARRIPVARPQR